MNTPEALQKQQGTLQLEALCLGIAHLQVRTARGGHPFREESTNRSSSAIYLLHAMQAGRC